MGGSRLLLLLACCLAGGTDARLQGCLGCYSTIANVNARSVRSAHPPARPPRLLPHPRPRPPARPAQVKQAAKAAMHIENAKRLRGGQSAVHLVKVLSGQQKRDQGTKFQLVVQVRGAGGIQTYNVGIWHRVKRTALGDIVSNKYQVSKFEDSDASFLGAYEEASDSAFSGSGGAAGLGHDNGAGGAKTAQCLCPPALAAWLCTQQEYSDVVSGKKCDYYKVHKFNTRR